jgi:hypothetical protein
MAAEREIIECHEVYQSFRNRISLLCFYRYKAAINIGTKKICHLLTEIGKLKKVREVIKTGGNVENAL